VKLIRKTIRRIILGLLVLIIIAALAVYLNLNRIVRRTIEAQATSSLNVQTTLSSVQLSLLGGNLSIGNLEIASPQGFASPKMLTLDQGGVQVSYGQLRADPIHIASVTLEKPRLVVEQSGGKFNIQALMDLQPAPPPDQKPIHVIIDSLTVRDATVVLRPGLPGLDTELAIPVPSLELKNVGRDESSQNGVALKQVAMEVITALAAKTGQANLPKELQAALQANAQAIAQQLGSEARKRVGDLAKPLEEVLKGTGVKLPGDLGKVLGGEKNKPKK